MKKLSRNSKLLVRGVTHALKQYQKREDAYWHGVALGAVIHSSVPEMLKMRLYRSIDLMTKYKPELPCIERTKYKEEMAERRIRRWKLR
jgi:hypothetical protein